MRSGRVNQVPIIDTVEMGEIVTCNFFPRRFCRSLVPSDKNKKRGQTTLVNFASQKRMYLMKRQSRKFLRHQPLLWHRYTPENVAVSIVAFSCFKKPR